MLQNLLPYLSWLWNPPAFQSVKTALAPQKRQRVLEIP